MRARKVPVMDRISWLGVARAASLRFVLLLGLVGLVLLLAHGPAPSSKGPFRIVGYLPDYRVAGFDAKASAALTDLIVFSSEPTAEGGLDLSRLKGVSWAQLQAFRKQEKVRLHLAVGGWGRSRHFGKVSTTPALRVAFAQAVEKACVDLQLDGIDLDWEHPAGATVFYAPIVLSNPLCLQCHGTPGREIVTATAEAIGQRYPKDRATGFRPGDIRGLWKVEFERLR